MFGWYTYLEIQGNCNPTVRDYWGYGFHKGVIKGCRMFRVIIASLQFHL